MISQIQLLRWISKSGTSILIITITDGIFTTTKQTILNVSSVNDPPELIFIDDQSVNEDNTFTYELFANDIENDELIYSAELDTRQTSLNRSGSLSIDDNILTFVPSDNFFGSVDIDVSVSDSQDSDNQSFTLIVNSINI